MMMPETRLKIYYAAEDFILGYTRQEILDKYDISTATYYRWKYSPAWEEATAGRERQKRKPVVTYDRFTELPTLKVTATRWVEIGEPPIAEYANRIGMPESRLREWMDMPFWEHTVAYARYKEECRKKQPKTKMRKAHWLPRQLVIQAVLYSLAGWKTRKIAKEVGRSSRTIQRWRYTDLWKELTDELMLSKMMMSLLDTGMTVRDLLPRIMASHRT